MSPRAVVNWWPDDEDDYEVARAELKKRFATWRGTEGDDSDAELPIHHKWTYGSGHLTRWTRRDLDEIYLEIYPAKVIVAEDELGEVLDEARQFMTFLADEDLLDSESDSLDLLVEHVNALAECMFALFKTELFRNPAVLRENGGHWKGLDDLELAISTWLHWFNEERIHTELDDLSPSEVEANYDVENRANAE